MVSSEVWSPECEMSMAIPSLFMRSTAARPNSVSPPSFFSRKPQPNGGLGADEHFLVRDVGQPHAQVPDDVVPLPASLGGDDGGPIHQAVEDGIDACDDQAHVAGPVAPGAAGVEDLVGI